MSSSRSSTQQKESKTKKRKKDQLLKSSNIAIIGGGIGGLSTALSLQLAGFSNVHVFERNDAPTNREQRKRRDGYGLTLTYNPKGPLAKMGILEELAQRDTPSRSHYVFSSDGFVMGYFGNAFVPHRGHGQRGNLRVPRPILRDIMLDKIKKNAVDGCNIAIHWKLKLENFDIYDSQMDGRQKIKIGFEDGTVLEDFDLLIGADGVRSKVRSQILSMHPYTSKESSSLQYTKIFLILGISHLDHPLLRQRGFYTLDGTHRLFTMPFEEDKHYEIGGPDLKEKKKRKTMWQLSFYLENEDEAMVLAKSSEDLLLHEVKKRVMNWHNPVLDMINSTETGSVWGTALVDQPTALHIHSKSCNATPPVILLGDAIHPMTPFKGQGANQALTDGPALAEWLQKSNLSSALLGFEREMHSRSRPKVLASRDAALSLHSQEVMDQHQHEQNIAGVRKECLEEVIKTLKEYGINANSGDKLDDKVREIIVSLGAGVDNQSLPSQQKLQGVDDNTIALVKKKVLSYAKNGDTFNLRNISIKYSCSVVQIARDKISNRSCLSLAAAGGHFHTTKWLLEEAGILDIEESEATDESGYDMMIDNMGQSPLHAAIIGGNPKVMGIILHKCKELGFEGWESKQDHNGDTPIMLVEKLKCDENTRKTLSEAFLRKSL